MARASRPCWRPRLGEMPNLRDVTLALLAGGEASRMGRPKGELQIAGRPVLDYLLDAFAWPGPTLLITAPGREHPPGWQRFTRECVDPLPAQGPLRGVLTALEHATTELLAVAAVDMPAVRAAHLSWLVVELTARPDLVMAMTSRSDGQIEPLPCAMKVTDARPLIAEAIASGTRSLYRLSTRPNVAALPAPPHWPAHVWTNLNRPDEWADWQTKTGDGG